MSNDDESLRDEDLTLGKRIARYRVGMRPKVTQAKLAQLTDVTVGMVNMWENDKAIPKAENRLALARIFGVHPSVMDYEVPEDNAAQGAILAKSPLADDRLAVLEDIPKIRALLQLLQQDMSVVRAYVDEQAAKEHA